MEASEAATSATEYLVLEKQRAQNPEESQAHNSNVWWVEREKVSARTPKDAVGDYIRKNGGSGGDFAAIPTRNFHEVPVRAETQTKLVFG